MNTAISFEQITEQEFFERFKPVKNTLAEHGSSYDDCMFETYGKEYEAVIAAHKKNPAQVWTVKQGDDGKPFIANGLHHVDRLGYIITEIAAPEGVDFESYDIEDTADFAAIEEEFEQCTNRARPCM